MIYRASASYGLPGRGVLHTGSGLVRVCSGAISTYCRPEGVLEDQQITNNNVFDSFVRMFYQPMKVSAFALPNAKILK
jgi:hypothetical protein